MINVPQMKIETHNQNEIQKLLNKSILLVLY
jgi:hypothetical protein